MPRAKAIGAFPRNTHLWFQPNMVADIISIQPHRHKSVVRRIFKRDSVIYSGHMINRLAGMRKARGISAVDLARQVGVTRQAIYAIEAGTYMLNTVVALRLARILDTSVEDLFALEEEEKPAGDVRNFEPLDDTFSFEA